MPKQKHKPSIGNIHKLDDDQVHLFHRDNQEELPAFDHTHPSEKELVERAQMIEMIKRAYYQKLIISTFGTFSTRVDKDAFLITPTARDRYYLQREDLVFIQNGKREKGKYPSRSTQVHQQIYRDHPEINSIIFAQSPNAMAYAVTRNNLIPEPYLRATFC